MNGVPIAAPRASDFSSGHGVFFLIYLRLVQPDMCQRKLFHLSVPSVRSPAMLLRGVAALSAFCRGSQFDFRRSRNSKLIM
jgi:hypothetical protein